MKKDSNTTRSPEIAMPSGIVCLRSPLSCAAHCPSPTRLYGMSACSKKRSIVSAAPAMERSDAVGRARSGEALPIDAHHEMIGPAVFFERAFRYAPVFDQTGRLVHADRALVMRQRPELDLPKVQDVEAVRDDRHQRVDAV